MADDLWAGATQAPAYLRVKKAPRARASDFDRAGGAMLRDRPDLAVARDRAATKRARQKRKDAIIAAGGQVIEAREPNVSEAAYDIAQGGLDAFYRQALGMNEQAAQQAAAASVQGVEGLVGAAEMERAGRNILGGEGSSDDYLTAGLTLAAGPALKLASKIPGVKYLGRKAAEGAKSLAARTGDSAAVKYLKAPSRRFSAGVEDAPSLAAKPTAPLALPAPPKVLALPAPKSKPKGKPRGGQFFPDKPLAARDAQAAGYKIENYTDRYGLDRYQVVRPSGRVVTEAGTPEMARRLAEQDYKRSGGSQYNNSPESAAREARESADLGAALGGWEPEDYGVVNMGGAAPQAEPASPFGDWLEKALAKYYKTDFGTEADPLADLAARGLHYEPDMTPERWLDETNSSLMEDPIGYYTVPRHASSIAAQHNPPSFSADLAGDADEIAHNLAPGLSYFGANDPIAQGALMQAAPWLRKQPVTDMLYGIREPLDLGHFADEMRNAMNAAESGLPADLAVRPEMLERMTFPQAVERVGRINQFRAQELARTEAEKRAETLRLAAQQLRDSPVTQTFKEYPDDPRGLRWVEMAPPKGEGAANYDVQDELQRALKFEGDTMGHCVGGYCPDVMAGSSRIFSLRDAEGMPHVTIETSPKDIYDLADKDLDVGDLFNEYHYGMNVPDKDLTFEGWVAKNHPETFARIPRQDIVQIKGPKNHKPQPEYLPFVQDFVKSGQWGDIGDLRNTDLVRLPDQRFITRQQAEQGVAAIPEGVGRAVYDPAGLQRMDPEEWAQLSPYFEGFKRGGLAVKKCGCMQCGGLAVRKAA